MTKKGRPTVREIDMGWGLINPDLGNDEVVHIPENPVDIETIHILEDPNDIRTGHAPESQGNAEIAHVLGSI